MEEIKCIDDIKNGWLVVVREGSKYIKVDGVLVGNCGGFLDKEDYGSGLKMNIIVYLGINARHRE